MNIPCDKTFPWVPLFFTLWPRSLTHFLTLLITFEQRVLELWYFTWVFLVIRPFPGFIIFDTVTLTLDFDPFFENLLITFEQWVLELWISLMNIPCDTTFPWVPLFFYPVTLTLEFDLLLKILTLLITFELWVQSFYIPSDKIFLLVLSLWPWPSLKLAIIRAFVFHIHILFFFLQETWKTITSRSSKACVVPFKNILIGRVSSSIKHTILRA